MPGTTTSNGNAPGPAAPRSIGPAHNAHIQHTSYLDLTRSGTSPPPDTSILLSTRTTPILIDPAKTALVVIDMQNFFLSSALDRTRGPGHAASEQLETLAVPAARKAGVRVIWLNWGLTDDDVDTMPPAVKRAFGDVGAEVVGDNVHVPAGLSEAGEKLAAAELAKGPTGISKSTKVYRGLGTEMGTVIVDGAEVDAGRMLMRDTWNAALHPPLDRMLAEGAQLPQKPDVLIHKDRMSGLWGARTLCEDFLEKEGLRTLLFTGVNTDQCVSGTLGDAFSKGYDCVLLSDGCGTTSPDYAQQCIEFNSMKSWGFLTNCQSFAEAVDKGN